jgi:hypothetical protein
MANLYLSMPDIAGVHPRAHQEKIGDSTGKLKRLSGL